MFEWVRVSPNDVQAPLGSNLLKAFSKVAGHIQIGEYSNTGGSVCCT